jgi:putative transposase
MKKYQLLTGKVSSETLSEAQQKLLGAQEWLSESLETLSAQAGLLVMDALLSAEIAQKLGQRGKQGAYRHGHQAGYVIYDGRKVPVKRPRVRTKEGEEVPLENYQKFQKDGDRQKAVARHLMRQCSTRNFEGALNDSMEGYGIKKSSVSAQWKVATAKQLQALMERKVPEDLVGLLLDGKHFQEDCIVVAMGITLDGTKHILGLWQGSTENSTLVKDLLTDLVERGLNPQKPLLIVLDGGKALRKAVDEVFGRMAVVQRCRVHKQRNVLDYLPKQMRRKVAWRLQAAWALEDMTQARKELESIARDLEKSCPAAARSLREGLEETLTLQGLGINDALLTSLASTNLIESAFSQCEAYCGRVKRWRSGDMTQRWAASALFWSEKQFRKVRGYSHLPQLQEALIQSVLEPIKKAA